MENTENALPDDNEEQSHGNERVANEIEDVTHRDEKETIENEIHDKGEEEAHDRADVSEESDNEAYEGEKRTHDSDMSITEDMTGIENIMKKEPIEDITISPDIIIKEEYEDEEPSTNTVWVAEGLMEEDEAKYCIPSTSETNEEKLIRAVKYHPHLYDFTNQNYHNSVHDKSWEVIGKQMGCSAEECKARWNSLVEYFSKVVQINSSKKLNQDPKRYKPWCLEAKMEFLRPFMIVQKDQVTTLKQLLEVNKLEENISERLSSKLSLPDSEYLKTGVEVKQESFTPMLDSIFKEYLGKKYKPQQDHLTKFFQSMEATVRTLPPLLQVKIKSQISKLVHDAEYEAVASCRKTCKTVPHPSRSHLTSSAVPYGPDLFSEQLRPNVLSHADKPVSSSLLSEYLTRLANPPTVLPRRPSNKNQLLSHL